MNKKTLPSFPWDILIEWYTKNGRHHLPWRDYSGNEEDRGYRVWLSEILLQQTQVDRVIPYFHRIIETYPTIHHLAESSYDEFFPYYQGMGYYSRARNILKTASIVSSEYDGVFPREKKLLSKLPGV
jgi:A/G-specific adenine glycosylase